MPLEKRRVPGGVPCAWCVPGRDERTSSSRFLPAAFCWTKMQAEAGQTLELILKRKELERAAGNGLFFWGVGNSLGSRVEALLRHYRHATVLFSVMRSRPKEVDASPDSVFLWSAYEDASGRVKPIPAHTLILSRATTALGPKKQHYALVCRSNKSLLLSSKGVIQIGHFRNLESRAHHVGSSQVTAIIEHVRSNGRGPSYAVVFSAAMTSPHFVRLRAPTVLRSAARRLLESAALLDNSNAWLDLVSRVRSHAGRR